VLHQSQSSQLGGRQSEAVILLNDISTFTFLLQPIGSLFVGKEIDDTPDAMWEVVLR